MKGIVINILKKIKILHEDDPIETVNKLKKGGVKVGEDVHIYDSYIDISYHTLIEIGNHVTMTKVTLLAHDASTKKFIGYTKIGKVKIGNYVFIGYGSIILPGTTIGDNVIIGAGTVVRGDIPENSVVIGNPCRIVCSTKDYINKNKIELEKGYIYDKEEDKIRMEQELDGIKGFIL